MGKRRRAYGLKAALSTSWRTERERNAGEEIERLRARLNADI